MLGWNIFRVLAVLMVFITTVYSKSTPSLRGKQDQRNDWPVIGLFTQPTSSTGGNCKSNCMYIAASYVKYLEAAGARVVPINYYASSSTLDNLFKSLNGFFFPGGGAAFPSSAQYIFDKVVAANDAGDFTPLWGTCMGFQWLLISASRDQNILDPKSGQMDAYNLSIPLEFTANAPSSRLFKDAGDVYDILAKQDVTMNNHHYGIYTEHFQSTPSLANFYNMLSTNKDRQGVEFVSTIEAFKYPIYGSQWHPEKNDFEWSRNADGSPYEAINHTPDGIKASQYTANFFVNLARNNFHSFASQAEEDAALIYNFQPVHSTEDFVQKYYFSKADLPM